MPFSSASQSLWVPTLGAFLFVSFSLIFGRISGPPVWDYGAVISTFSLCQHVGSKCVFFLLPAAGFGEPPSDPGATEGERLTLMHLETWNLDELFVQLLLPSAPV